MAQMAQTPLCPMAEICKGMMERPLSGLVMMIPGIVLMCLGVLIVAWPSVLPWLVAAACIVAGCMMFLMANFMRGIGARYKHAGS